MGQVHAPPGGVGEIRPFRARRIPPVEAPARVESQVQARARRGLGGGEAWGAQGEYEAEEDNDFVHSS